jgi:hypothetical protein
MSEEWTAEALAAEGKRIRKLAEQDLRDLRAGRETWLMRGFDRLMCMVYEHGPFDVMEELDRVQVRADIDLVKRRLRCASCGKTTVQTQREARWLEK